MKCLCCDRDVDSGSLCEPCFVGGRWKSDWMPMWAKELLNKNEESFEHLID